MALRRGHQAMKEKASERGQGMGDTYALRLSDGQSVTARICGDIEGEEYPVLSTVHYIKRLPYPNSFMSCGENTDSSCVPCYLRGDHVAGKHISHENPPRQPDKGIGKGGRSFFHVIDLTKKHKLDSEVRLLKPGIPRVAGKEYKPDDYFKTKYPECRAPKQPCQFCKQGAPLLDGGSHRTFELADQFAEQLINLQYDVRDFCHCGALDNGAGTIGVNRYLCSECEEEVDYDPETAAVTKCGSCKKTFTPLEEITCSACEDPTRGRIQDFKWKITRTGSQKATAYKFEVIHPIAPMDAELLKEVEAKTPNWESICAPLPPARQAAILCVQNPFGDSEGHGSTTYEDTEPTDEVDYSSADDDETSGEVDEPVVKKKKFVLKLKRS